jgi:trimethylamine:corrinoid methyltransferase-like protein
MERWQAEGQPEARRVLREKTQAMLADLSVPDDYEDLVGKGTEFIQKREKQANQR